MILEGCVNTGYALFKLNPIKCYCVLYFTKENVVEQQMSKFQINVLKHHELLVP